MIIAIDGGVATGKSAVGRRVAEAVGLPFVDTGLMYRAVALAAQADGTDTGDGAALTRFASGLQVKVDGRRVWAGGEELTDRVYAPELSPAVSQVAKVAGVRLAMAAQQRALGRGGVVMAGRDIGTVVFPDAEFKFYLEASVDERVRRRALQKQQRGEEIDASAMAREVQERDRVDSERSVAPLRPAEDAIVINTDDMPLDAVVQFILTRVQGGDGR